MLGRVSPPDCLVCGQSHSTCQPSGAPSAITIAMAPQRDLMRVPTHDETLAAELAKSPTAVSTKIYRRKAKQ